MTGIYNVSVCLPVIYLCNSKIATDKALSCDMSPKFHIPICWSYEFDYTFNNIIITSSKALSCPYMY